MSYLFVLIVIGFTCVSSWDSSYWGWERHVTNYSPVPLLNEITSQMDSCLKTRTEAAGPACNPTLNCIPVVNKPQWWYVEKRAKSRRLIGVSGSVLPSLAALRLEAVPCCDSPHVLRTARLSAISVQNAPSHYLPAQHWLAATFCNSQQLALSRLYTTAESAVSPDIITTASLLNRKT